MTPHIMKSMISIILADAPCLWEELYIGLLVIETHHSELHGSLGVFFN